MSAIGEARKILAASTSLGAKELSALETLIRALVDNKIAEESTAVNVSAQLNILEASTETTSISVIGDLYKVVLFEDGVNLGMSFAGAASGSREGIVVPAAGEYLLAVSGYFIGSAGTVCNMVPHIDDTPYGDGIVFRSAATSGGNPPTPCGGTAILHLTEGEEVSLYVSNTLNANDLNWGDLSFSLVRVG
jgi:hypothetical protein